MIKKITALMLVVLVCFSFSACSSDDDIYVDEYGNHFIVVRDQDGSIVVNESGKLQVYTLNENGKKQKSDAGEYITKYVDFNGQVVIGNTVETVEMRFTVPSNFSSDYDLPGYFYYEDYSGEIFLTYYNESIEDHIRAMEFNCESLLESFGSENFEYEKYEIKIDGIECQAFRQSCTSSEYYRNTFNYYIPYDTGFYVVNCVISTDYANNVNFDRFAKSIELK